MSAVDIPVGSGPTVMATRGLGVRTSSRAILEDITLDFPDRMTTAIIGPSGCGKTTLIRTLNRMTELSPGLSIEGEVLYRGQNIYDPAVSPVIVRQKIGMVFQRPVVFPMTVYENVAFGLRIAKFDEETLHERVIESIQRAALWDQVGDDLYRPALELSGGQQQRLCIARALAVQPRVLLLDEPTASLDPQAAKSVESLITELDKSLCVIIVTHNLLQATRVADRTAFLYEGRLVEVGPTEELFERPKERLTEEYITGRFG